MTNEIRVFEGATYRHKKTGGVYQVIAIGKNEADLTPGVVYASNFETWVRPLSEFADGRFEPTR